jgi:ABC-type bacteriocin/lantibiotic exporter with double-glycine peptidase domain
MDSPASPTAEIKRTPTILQMEAAECGAACLAMVLAHYGAWVPLERLRVECGVSRDGSKGSNIVRAAKRFGLSAKGFRLDLAALGSAPTPCGITLRFLSRFSSRESYPSY